MIFSKWFYQTILPNDRMYKSERFNGQFRQTVIYKTTTSHRQSRLEKGKSIVESKYVVARDEVRWSVGCKKVSFRELMWIWSHKPAT